MRIPTAVKEQPGYDRDRGVQYRVQKTIEGRYRLFAKIGSKWMDASLADDDRLAKYEGRYF